MFKRVLHAAIAALTIAAVSGCQTAHGRRMTFELPQPRIGWSERIAAWSSWRSSEAGGDGLEQVAVAHPAPAGALEDETEPGITRVDLTQPDVAEPRLLPPVDREPIPIETSRDTFMPMR